MGNAGGRITLGASPCRNLKWRHIQVFTWTLVVPTLFPQSGGGHPSAPWEASSLQQQPVSDGGPPLELDADVAAGQAAAQVRSRESYALQTNYRQVRSFVRPAERCRMQICVRAH